MLWISCISTSGAFVEHMVLVSIVCLVLPVMGKQKLILDCNIHKLDLTLLVDFNWWILTLTICTGSGFAKQMQANSLPSSIQKECLPAEILMCSSQGQ